MENREGTNNNTARFGLTQHEEHILPPPHGGLIGPSNLLPSPPDHLVTPPGPQRPNFFLMGQPIFVAAPGVQHSENAAPSFNLTIPVENSASALNKKRERPIEYNPEGSLTANLAPRPNADEGQIVRLHVLTVNAGEDVVRKIMTFAQQGSQTICILSANGPISSVTLRQPMSSGGTITYKGDLEIHSLTGYIPSESGVTLVRDDGIRATLVRPGCTIFGGRLAGDFIAAGPVTVRLLSFVTGQEESQQPQQQIKKQRREGLGIPATAQVANISSGGSEEDPNARYRLNKPVVLQPRPVSAPPVLIQPVPVSEPPVSAPPVLIQPVPVPVSEAPVSFSHGPSTDTVHAYNPNDKKV